MLLEMALVLSLLDNPHNPEVTREQDCFIKNAIYEAIGEGPRGMQLATEVALNRLDANHRGARTMCEVIYSPAQFSWTMTPEEERLPYDDEDYHRAAQVVLSVLYDAIPRALPQDILHYQNPSTATDKSWYESEKVVLVYGGHHFLRTR